MEDQFVRVSSGQLLKAEIENVLAYFFEGDDERCLV